MADSDKLGLGLDDIIRHDRTSTNRRGGGGGGKRGFRGRGAGGGAGRQGGQMNGFRTRGGGGLPRPSATPAGRWKHDLFEDNSNRSRGVGQRVTTGVNTTTKLLISNLDYSVTTSDVQELFEDIGAVRVARVHYDESGRSLGTAEVIFERRVDAANAQQKYNGLNLDGRPMDIRLIGAVNDGSQQQQQTPRASYTNGNSNGNQRSGFRNNNNQQNGTRNGGNFSRGGGGGGKQQQNGTRNNTKKENVTAEDLDAELEAYRAESAPKK
ncbi:unnamed protein product [Adineta steineri]|uniref:RRM domain-containing protein n=1 Tax=Adineta steineri TaxID=433720 RepID=A0A813U5Q3_9BILA|nr:unnamed protein product [Adineta steineri]CAF3906193.1 unnamed protein product [Adineta steineri]